jgi:AAHS family benzoate transporter-like MFS transporter
MPRTPVNQNVTRTRAPVIAVCWLLIFVDGYDVVSYGAVVPALLEHDGLRLSAPAVGVIGALTLVGMAIGAAMAGYLLHLVGRRALLVGCLVWFSIAVTVAAFAASGPLLGLFRGVAGIGLGCLLPVASALALDHTAPARRTLVYGMTFSAYPLGGMVAGILAGALLPNGGFRIMLAAGGLALLVVPVVLWLVPRNERSAAPDGRRATSARGGAVVDLFRERGVASTVLLWAATFLCLLVIYGLYTWLPAIMRAAGYDLGSALVFLVVLNVGGVAGMLLAGWTADLVGIRRVAGAACLCAGLSIGALSPAPPAGLSFALIAVAGISAIGAQVVINACVSEFFSPTLRATSLGWSLGVGRFGAIAGPPLGSVIVVSALPVRYHFYAFGLAALLAAVALAVVPRQARSRAAAPLSATTLDSSTSATR